MKLKSCPFCGSDDLEISSKLKHYHGESYMQVCVYCRECNAYGSRVNGDKFPKYSHHTREELTNTAKDKAIELWNRRIY